MVTDNGFLIKAFTGNSKDAVFAREIMSGRAHYIALNRAARRVLQSNKFQNRMKRINVKIDFETMAVS